MLSQVGPWRPLCGSLASNSQSAGNHWRGQGPGLTWSDVHFNKMTLSAMLEMKCSIKQEWRSMTAQDPLVMIQVRGWWLGCQWRRLLMVFLFFKIFFMWAVFKVFIEFVSILLLFYVLGFWLQGMRDPSSPTRD